MNDEEDQMKAEAVWAEALTAEGVLTWDTEQRAALLNWYLDRKQVVEFSPDPCSQGSGL